MVGAGPHQSTTEEEGPYMTATTTGIDAVSLISLPVDDQDRSIAFYESIGFEKRTDIPFAGGQMRWVEVYAPEGSTGIALVPPPGNAPAEAKDSGIILRSSDIDLTHEALAERGVDVDAEIMRPGEPVPDMFWFRDVDGHSLLVVADQR